MAARRERLVQEITDLKSEITTLSDSAAFFADSGKVGVDPLPDTIRMLREKLANLENELEALDAHRP